MIVVARFGAERGVDFRDYALFLPGVGVALVLAAILSGRLGQAIRQPRGIAFALVFSLGVIVAATLTPSRDALQFGSVGSGTCDLTSLALPSLHDFRSLNDTSLNVALFVPLGIAIGATARSAVAAGLLVAGLAVPFAIEAIQLVATPLDRACQAVDVIDNEVGLLIGLVLAIGVVLAGRLAAPTRPDRGSAGDGQRDAM
jgi:hypothetical protein